MVCKILPSNSIERVQCYKLDLQIVLCVLKSCSLWQSQCHMLGIDIVVDKD